MESLLNTDLKIIENPIFDSKGTGGVMHSTPIGLVIDINKPQ